MYFFSILQDNFSAVKTQSYIKNTSTEKIDWILDTLDYTIYWTMKVDAHTNDGGFSSQWASNEESVFMSQHHDGFLEFKASSPTSGPYWQVKLIFSGTKQAA